MAMTVSHDHTLAREATLRVLYQVDVRALSSTEEVQALLDETLEDFDMEPATSPPAVEKYARRLVYGVMGNRADLDSQISKVAKNWDIERMAVIDRNVIRIGSYEILKIPDVPRAVAINEAIELAKKYSTVESGTFVNGILDQIRA